MLTVAELIEWYSQQNETIYTKIEVLDKHTENYYTRKFTDVSNVYEKDGVLSFYGRAEPKKTRNSSTSEQNEIRFIRINDSKITYSEV